MVIGMLRVVSGKWKGRKILEVDRLMTRPTSDRNKETLFNVLGQYFSGGVVLDLFAGTGALGIEALSRGFDKGVFIDHSRIVCNIIRNNLAGLNAINDSEVICGDCLSYLEHASGHFDLILADPPYLFANLSELLSTIGRRKLLNADGMVVLETRKDALLPEVEGDLEIKRSFVSGIARFTIYVNKEESS